MKLDQLLPIQAARERHAQRIYHEKKYAYDLAESAKEDMVENIRKLNQKHLQLLFSALHSGLDITAFKAQNILANADILMINILHSEKELDNMKILVKEAFEAMDLARQTYQKKVSSHHKIKKLCKMETLRKLKIADMLTEMNSEDEYATIGQSDTSQGVFI